MPTWTAAYWTFIILGIMTGVGFTIAYVHDDRVHHGTDRRTERRRSQDRYDYIVRIGNLGLALVAGGVSLAYSLFQLLRWIAR